MRAMPDPLNRAKRFREHAAEYRQLAGISAEQPLILEYERIAEHYALLAEAEEKLAGGWRSQCKSTARKIRDHNEPRR